VLNLGSGFSSYVLQRYRASAAPDVAVVSVDTDADWLAKTRRYLGEQDIDDAHLVEWPDFESRTWEPFDVIFHDLAGGDLRESAMPVAVRNMAGAGCIVFDDANHAGHRRRAYEVGRENNLSVYSVFDWTHDTYGQYSLLGVA
jgi:predicted O-methyltransferase YrrM